MRQVAGMGQRDAIIGPQHVRETQALVDPDQRIAARTDHHPADLARQAIQVGRLHQHQPGLRIDTRQHGQPGQFGARLVGQPPRQDHAAFQLQRYHHVALDPRGADGRAGGLVAAQQDRRAALAVGGVGHRQGLLHLRNVVTIGVSPDAADVTQVSSRRGE
ncbi:hypothetical protein ASE08_09065 [Rhizobacter sp. Root16D2]|nr:hypothetical protein ASE08_09065 [Rhizobacter sp. Root16D2]